MTTIATSRTGTGKYKRWRTATLHQAQADGLTHCPCTAHTCRHHTGTQCKVPLDYTIGKRPNSAEPDHITPHANGGQDHIDNGQVICRRCNQSLGNKKPRRATKPATTITLNSSDW